MTRPAGTYVWDVPTRLFHWALVAAVATSLYTGEFGPMDIHVIGGHVVLGLLLFRLVWGFVGGRHARFASFVRGPAAVIGYARGLFGGKREAHAGHNPMGAWSVLALLGILAVQVGTGLFANDDILTEGPLAKTVDSSVSDTLTSIHHLSVNAVYALIALHLAAIVFYAVKGERLVPAMITGVKKGLKSEAAAGDARGNLIVAVVVALAAGAIAYAVMNY